jgi:N-acetylglucosamine-6-phosphate deacetylase
MHYLLRNCTFYTGTAVLTHHALLIENGQITALLPDDTSSLPADVPVVDGRGLSVAPGLLDLQIYGAAGQLFSVSPGLEALQALARHTFRHGTTGFMATMPTNSWGMMRMALEVGREFQRHHPALGLLGIHLEGPYINPLKKGAHQQEFIHAPTVAEIDELLKLADGVLKIMTLAPEVATPAVVARLREAGVVLSAGHSNATYGQASTGFREGFTAATHLFNAMSALQGREPGMVGAIYDAPDTQASIIADGIHCDFTSVRISKKIMQERLFLITDAVTDSTHGAYRNCVEHVGLSLEESLRMATLYPARVIGQDDKLGLLQGGYTADFFLFDADLQVHATARGGELHWH